MYVPVGDCVLPAGFVGVTEGSEVCLADQWVGQGVGGARESSTAHTQILPQSVKYHIVLRNIIIFFQCHSVVYGYNYDIVLSHQYSMPEVV